MSTGGDKGDSSSTNPNPSPPAGQSPNRPPTASPVAAGSPSRPRQRLALSSPAGQASFLAFPRPHLSPQRPHGTIVPWPLDRGQGGPGGSSATGLGLHGPFGFLGVPGAAVHVPVGSGVGGSPVGDRLRIGGVGGSPASKKRGRDGGPSGSRAGIQAVAAEWPGEGAGEPEVHACSLCNKTFASIKALFGHLRSHPERGWKGAHPPPTFNAEEEFADFPGVNLAGGVVQGGGQEVVVADQTEVVPAVAGGGDGEVAAEESKEGEPAAAPVPPKGFRVPDLNDSPPAE